jgi:hypothetical protein
MLKKKKKRKRFCVARLNPPLTLCEQKADWTSIVESYRDRLRHSAAAYQVVHPSLPLLILPLLSWDGTWNVCIIHTAINSSFLSKMSAVLGTIHSAGCGPNHYHSMVMPVPI